MPHKYHGPESSNAVHGHGLKVLVDTANVAYENRNGPNDKPTIDNVFAMRHRLEELDLCPYFIADASLRYAIDEPEKLDHLEQSGWIHQSPAGTQADYFLLALAERDFLPVISNDFYRDREDEFPLAVKDLRVPFMIVDGQVVLEQERLRQAMQIVSEHTNDSQHCHHRHHRHGEHRLHERHEHREDHQPGQQKLGAG